MRVFKQLLYGFLYLLVFSLIALGVYRIYFYGTPTCFDNVQNQNETEIDCGGSCVSCEFKNAELKTENVEILNAGNGRISLLAKINNPVNYSAKFEYKIDIISFGTSVYSVSGVSSANPNDERYIVIPGLLFESKDASRAAIQILTAEWDENPDEKLPNVKLKNSETVFTNGEARITGILLNDSLDLVDKARVTAILVDNEDNILSASAVDVTNIRTSGEKSFTIFFPKISSAVLDLKTIKTKVFTEIIETQ